MRVVGVFQKLANEIVPQYSGRIVKFVGDAALAEFASTDGAIRSALMLVGIVRNGGYLREVFARSQRPRT